MGVCGPAARGASPHKQEAGLQGGPHTVLHSDHDPEVGGRGLWAQRASRSATTGNFSVRRSLGGAGPGDTAGGGGVRSGREVPGWDSRAFRRPEGHLKTRVSGTGLGGKCLLRPFPRNVSFESLHREFPAVFPFILTCFCLLSVP